MQDKLLTLVQIGPTFGSPLGQDASAGGVSLGQLITNAVTASIVGAGVVLLFFIIFAGFHMIGGSGSGNPQEAAKARQAATYAIAGFVVVFIAFWVIQLLEAVTGVHFVTAPGF